MREHDGFDESFSRLLNSSELDNLKHLFDFHHVERNPPANIDTEPSRADCFNNLHEIEQYLNINSELISRLARELSPEVVR